MANRLLKIKKFCINKLQHCCLRLNSQITKICKKHAESRTSFQLDLYYAQDTQSLIFLINSSTQKKIFYRCGWGGRLSTIFS